MRRRTSVALGVLLLGAAVLAPGRALSQTTAEDKAAAEALFDEGKKLLADKRFAEACKRFESSQKLDPGVGTLLFLADCYETVGRTASAWSTFREAAAAAKSANQGDREQIARDRAAKLDGKLFQLTLAVAGAAAPGLQITRNDAVVKKEVWGLGLPVDPGTCKITAAAPGKKTWSTTVEIPSEAGGRTIQIPELADAPAEVPTSSAAATATVAPVPAATGWSTGRTAGLALGIAGLVGVGVGGVFGGIAGSQFNQAKLKCPNVACGDKDGVNLSHSAGSMADVATGLFIAGGVVLAGGIVLFLVSPGASKEAPKTSWISPYVGGGAAGLRAGSTF